MDVLETDTSRQDDVVDDTGIRPFPTVRPGDLLGEALTALRRRSTHMGRVVDDAGEVVGLITLDDVLGELVGDIG